MNIEKEVGKKQNNTKIVIIGICLTIVDKCLCHLLRHPFIYVLAHEVAVFAGQLAVICDDASDVFRHVGSPMSFIVFIVTIELENA